MTALINKIQFEKYSSYKNNAGIWLKKIPSHWALVRLGSKFEERRTKVSDKDFIPLSVTKQGILPQLDSAAKSNDGDNRKLVKAGDFVINSRSDRKGSSGIASIDGSVSLINIVLIPKDIDQNFCNYFLKSHSFVEEFYRVGHGIVADLWTTRYEDMKIINIGVPNKLEQIAIAKFLDKKIGLIDKAIQIKEKQIELLKEHKQILIENAVLRGLNSGAVFKDSGIKWIDEIPAHWSVKRLKYILSSQGRIGFKGYTTSDLVDEGALTLGASHLDWDGNILLSNPVYISWRKYYESPEIMVSTNDIIIVQRGSTCGKVALIRDDLGPTTINPSLVLLKKITVCPEFVFFALKVVLNSILNLINNTAIPMLSQFQIDNISIPIPPNDEQLAIVKYITMKSIKIDASISLQENEIEKLKEYKITLVNSVVNGKIKVS